MNPLFLALNILVIAIVALAVAWPRLRERRRERVEASTTSHATRAGQELTDAVTEWARATGVLTPDGSAPGSDDPDDGPDVTG